jgi:hypothetical protein
MSVSVFPRTIFNVTIAGQTFPLAALTLRETEKFGKEEQAALESKDQSLFYTVRCETLATSMTKAGRQVTADQIAEELSAVVVHNLYRVLVESNGLKLETDSKVGEAVASQSS